MIKVTYVAQDGTETTLEAEEGASVMRTAVSNDLDGIVGECGGSMMCATCHCYQGHVANRAEDFEQLPLRCVLLGLAECVPSNNRLIHSPLEFLPVRAVYERLTLVPQALPSALQRRARDFLARCADARA